jgi:hypothetical protein
MPFAEFEEREYEIAATIELAGVSGVVLGPGQVAEKLLGYDTATNPTADNPIWEVLRIPRLPACACCRRTGLPVHDRRPTSCHRRSSA